MNATGTITAVIVDYAGSGYSAAPMVTIHNGTLNDPAPFLPGGLPAVATSTLALQSVVVNTFGSGYTSAPTVVISDTGTGSGASATAAFTTAGSITSIIVDNPGSGYMTPGIQEICRCVTRSVHATGLSRNRQVYPARGARSQKVQWRRGG